MNGWKHDFNYGFRMLVRNPGFTVVILLSLALGIHRIMYLSICFEYNSPCRMLSSGAASDAC
jgi:hypothetical protein